MSPLGEDGPAPGEFIVELTSWLVGDGYLAALYGTHSTGMSRYPVHGVRLAPAPSPRAASS